MQPQRLVVPLFQRPYVWNEENQWEPLWSDVVRLAERILLRPTDRHHPHFLGAVVLQQVQKQTGQMQERTIIDGQQRLTTLQLLMDALGAELQVSNPNSALKLDALVTNPEHYRAKSVDRFKVWPTNRDRPAFNAVMGAEPPLDYEKIAHPGERIVEAHKYFTGRVREWLATGITSNLKERCEAIETAVRDLLQIVVIDLGPDENAQEIFETLNARGAQLTSADLIKNFIFQRLLETGADVEAAYEDSWKEFETGFWETEVSVGRLRYPRTAIFLNHWLVARTGEEILAREVFDRFKQFSEDSAQPMRLLLREIHSAARVYKEFVTSASASSGSISRLGLFNYRTGVLESEVIKPLILYLYDPEESGIPEAQLSKALDVVESWMVRRMLVRATTKNYNRVVAELISLLRREDRNKAGDLIAKYFSSQSTESSYWPDDLEVGSELTELLAYRRLSRARLRMVLEALEDDARGWKNGEPGLGGERVARGRYAIEHVMPRKWQDHWPIESSNSEQDRDRIIHTLGNLTLLTTKLNSKISNGAWVGESGKRESLHAHDVFFLNRQILRQSDQGWTDEAIRLRTRSLVDALVRIWPVPPDFRSGYVPDRPKPRKKVTLSDLIVGGALQAGMTLFPRRKKYTYVTGTLLPDGRVEVDGVAFAGPSDAARKIVGKPTNGWSFFLASQTPKKSLRDVRNGYIQSMALYADEDESDEDGDEDEV